MLASGSDNPVINTINIVGMRRAGISAESIDVIKRAHRLLYREMKPLDAVRAELAEELDGIFPFELSTLLNFLEKQRRGKMGRAREIYRNQVGPTPEPAINRRAA
jgi:UDP-N-acetylglucosamine acyltransferase